MLNFVTVTNKNKMIEENVTSVAQDRNEKKPWVEKYRPKTLNDISFQEEAVSAFRGILNTGEMPHLLLYGPPGTGKTSIILALAKELFGDKFYRDRILELNASDDRGIQKVREKVKKYAATVCVKNPDKSFKCPNYKIIILDEADHMTLDAQGALRRIIEDFSKQTRFVIICNYITKIIEPLSSRCIKFRFKEIPMDSQTLKLAEICRNENINYTNEHLEFLISVSDGDLRKSTNMLQTAALINDNTLDTND